MANVLVPLIFFTFLGAVTLVPIWLSARARSQKLELVREALARGQPLDPALVAVLADDRDPRRMLRRTLFPGVILTFLGVGLAAGSGIAPPEAHEALLIAALIDGCIGLGFLLLAAFEWKALGGRADR